MIASPEDRQAAGVVERRTVARRNPLVPLDGAADVIQIRVKSVVVATEELAGAFLESERHLIERPSHSRGARLSRLIRRGRCHRAHFRTPVDLYHRTALCR